MKKAESKPAVNKHNALKNGSSFFKGNDSMLSAENQDDIQPFFNGTSTIQTKSDTSLIRAKPFFQAKLTVGQPNDKFEQEADAMADKIVQRMANEGATQPSYNQTSRSEIRMKCAACDQEEKLKNPEEQNLVQRKPIFENSALAEETLQRKPIFENAQEVVQPSIGTNSAPTHPLQLLQAQESLEEEGDQETKEENSQENVLKRMPIFESNMSLDVQANAEGAPNSVNENLENRLNNSKGRGSPLTLETRNAMEPAFGADFSNVRVHTGREAVDMSSGINAQAFTHGSDIYFNEGKYDPNSSSGNRLLAHELTHTIQQGSVAIQPKRISTINSQVIQRKSWIRRKIESGLNWAAERLVPGYSLLNVILGKNLITDDPVPRTGENIIRGYMRLLPVIGSILLNELEETNTLKEAGIWVKGKVEQFGIDFDDIANRLRIMWDEISVWNGIDGNIKIFKKYIGPVLGKFLAFSSVVQEKVKELRFEGALLLVGATKLLAAMKKDPKAFKRLVDNPKLLLKHFMDAIKKGFLQFKDNFGKHFKNALFGWLFGKAAEMGIEIPKKFDVAGLFHLIAQLVGATYQQIRAMVVKRLGPKGELIISKLEQSVEVVKDLVTNGPIALWNRVKDFLKNLKEMIFSAISSLVTSEIIKTAVAKLVSMLNPVGAIVQLVLTIYRVIRYFIDWWETIKEIATGILNTITNVALGKIGQAANFIENIMGKGMKLIIAFLARIFGLGGIAAKVKKLIKKIADPVKKAIGKVVRWIVNKGRKLFGKVISNGKSVGKKVKEKLGNWWRKKNRFTAKNGEKHSLYFESGSNNSELMIASTPMLVHKLIKEILKTDEGKKVAPKIKKTLKQIYDKKRKIRSFSKKNELKNKKLIDEIQVLILKLGRLFSKISLGKAKKMSKVDLQFQNNFIEFGKNEFNRQLKEQQTQLRKMTITRWLSNRNAFEANMGRINDKELRKKILGDVNFVSIRNKKQKEEFIKKQKAKGIRDKKTLDSMWQHRMAATHRLDQVAGGEHYEFAYLGSNEINSEIGAQWPSKIKTIVEEVEKVDPSVYEKIKMNIYLKS